MAGFRTPGPLGMTPSPATQDAESGVLGNAFPPGPVGDEIPLENNAPQPQAAKTGKELNLVGSFPKPASWTAAREKAQIASGKWFPHTLDFKGVAGAASIEVKTAWDFLLKIFQASGPISRLNFFSHATTGLIAIEGEILDDGSNVTLGPSGADGKWTQIISGKPGAIMDPYANTWGTFGENSGSVKVKVGTTEFTLDDIRSKFTSDAALWLYLCHGASDPNLFQEVANTFQITAKGFTKALVYCAPQDFPSSRKHKVAVLTTAKEEDSCPNAVADFRSLDTNSDVRTASPKKPKPPGP